MNVRYVRHPDLRITALEGEGVALHLGTRRYYSLSESGLDLMEALVEPRRLEELVKVLTEKYEVTEDQAEATTLAFLQQGVSAGTIIAEGSP